MWDNENRPLRLPLQKQELNVKYTKPNVELYLTISLFITVH